ncbi:putative 2OG-Fe(II) oxygenase [Candidatus Pelagibacter sp. HIMB1611]|uniref:putative 2OG-Fe(II) oxygenase n=1 Tax=unclassified Candidatus Pelagibacter TaxID=2647897 RepID=UPI003F86DA00
MSSQKENDWQISRPFGPSVFKVKIPQTMVDKLNEHIDTIILDNQKSNELNLGYKLAGDVTQEFKLEQNFMKECGWLNFLAQCVQKWIKVSIDKDITKFNIIESWVVRQFQNEYNPVHWHAGHISGAGFLKVPSTLGKHIQNKEDVEYLGGTLNLIHGTRQFLSNSTQKIIPKVGDFYFFPHYLMHTVYPFKDTDEERRSISFNGLIDESIFQNSKI